MYSLEAKIRTEIAKEARLNDVIPAVLYGKDTPSTMVAVGVSEFIKVYRITGRNNIISLTVDKKKYNVLVHEAQRHPVTGAFLHLDFLTVDMKSEIHVQIPVNLTGISPAVLAGGELNQIIHALDVKCLPTDIVTGFELDISTLTENGMTLCVSDMNIDTKKFQLMSQPGDSVVSVQARKWNKEDEEVEAASVADVWVATAKEEAAE